MKEVLDRFEHTNRLWPGYLTNNTFSNYSVTQEVQPTVQASGIGWRALRNTITCMAHIVQITSGGFMSSPSANSPTKCWESPEQDQQVGEHQQTAIRKSERLRTEGNARIDRVSAMGAGFASIIENIHISRYFESHETNLHTAGNVCCIEYTETACLKGVHSL